MLEAQHVALQVRNSWTLIGPTGQRKLASYWPYKSKIDGFLVALQVTDIWFPIGPTGQRYLVSLMEAFTKKG